MKSRPNVLQKLQPVSPQPGLGKATVWREAVALRGSGFQGAVASFNSLIREAFANPF